MSKQIAGPTATKDHPVSIVCDIFGFNFCTDFMATFPIISLALVDYIVLKLITFAIHQRFLKYFIMSGTILSYTFVVSHWASESIMLSHPKANVDFGIRLAPRFVYAIGALSLAISVICRWFGPIDCLKSNKRITTLSTAMLCSWSPTILILLGRQGSFVALICIIGGTFVLTLFFNRRFSEYGILLLALLEFFFFISSLGSIVSEN
jgi:phosphatidylinositol glycan class O